VDRAVHELSTPILKLRSYPKPYAENDINFSVHPDLTDPDLKEIAVALDSHLNYCER
jgi:hypothetical protein